MISLGFIVGLIIFGIITLGCLLTIVICLASDDDYGDGKATAVITFLCYLFIVLPIAAWGFWPPFNMEYHSYKTVEGKVTEVNSRLVTAGDKGGSNQKFVLKFEGSDLPYGCEDTRCATLKPGSFVKLNCIRKWEYASVSGYNCRWNNG